MLACVIEGVKLLEQIALCEGFICVNELANMFVSKNEDFIKSEAKC